MSTVIEAAVTDTIPLSVEQTVPRSLVHKRSLENVFLTEVRPRGENHFVCAGRIPTVHRFFNDTGRTPQKDILFYTELGQQASLAISHTFLGVSKEDIVVFEQSQAWMRDVAWRSGQHSTADSVITEITIHETETRKSKAVSRVVGEQIMSIGGQQVFHGMGAWTIQPAALFRRLRKMSQQNLQASTESPLQDVGFELSRLMHIVRDSVVIFVPISNVDRTQFVTSLIVDDTHRYFFDHPCDHVPGMLLLEGCMQLAQAAVSKRTSVPRHQIAVSAYDVDFRQFVECDAPVKMAAQFPEPPNKSDNRQPTNVEIAFSQKNVLCGTATVTVAFLN